MKDEKKLNLQVMFMTLGFLLLIFAFVSPFYLDDKLAEYLGVAATPFVSAAAFLLLVSANIMQQKELTLQRKELSETREVFKEQSKTMSRQRFESTFFNMVNLHHTILSNLKMDTTLKSNSDFSTLINSEGRELISNLYEEFRYIAHKEYRGFKFNKYLTDAEIEEIFNTAYPKYEKNRLFEELSYLEYHSLNEKEHELLVQQINEGKSSFDKYPSLQEILEEHPRIYDQIHNTETNLRYVLLNFPKEYYSADYHPSLDDEFSLGDNNEWEEVKIHCYEMFYKRLEYIFGHYYRNLYRIIKYINESELIDELSKKEFRGILRAQLSSDELMMLFYNVVYSKKGKKFKNQIKDKNFFDDHLVHEDFVWNDDALKLIEIK